MIFATSNRRSFTLIELMIVISLIALVSASFLSALFSVTEDSKEARTKAQIVKLHELILEKWESYLTRPMHMVPLTGLPLGPEQYVDANQNGIWDSGETYTDRDGDTQYDYICLSFLRQLALHDLMRMELPDRITDLTNSPISPALYISYPWGRHVPPSLWLSYRRKAQILTGPGPSSGWPLANAAPASWSSTYQGAECLYLIVSQTKDGDAKALDFFTPTEIGDIDEDGFPEILDGWGRPISFLRWPAGFATLPGADGAWGAAGVDDDGNGTVDDDLEIGWTGTDDRSELMERSPATSPDPMNPFGGAPAGYALFPLIYSAGRDGLYDIVSDDNPSINYSTLTIPSNPYTTVTGGLQIGKPTDADQDGDLMFFDNITNHSIVGT